MFYSKKFKTFNQGQIKKILGNSNEIPKPNKILNKYNSIYENPNFDIGVIEKNPTYNWNYSKLILSRNFIPLWYHKYKDNINFTSNDYLIIYNHPNFDITWIEELKIEKPNFYKISGSKNFKEKWIELYPCISWNTNLIKTTPNYSTEWILKYPNLSWMEKFYNFTYTSDKKLKEVSDFRIEMYRSDIKWNYEEILSSKYFDISWIEKLDLSKIQFHNVQKNINFKIEWIYENPQYNWCFIYLSTHKDLDISWILNMPDKNWSLISVVNNPNFDIEWLEIYPELKKCTSFIRMTNPKLQMEWIDKYPDLQWNLAHISKAENLTYQWYLKNPHLKWKNKDLLLNDNFIRSISIHNLKYFFSIIKIQKWWLNNYYSPYTEVGKKRFKRKFEEIFE